MIKISIKIAVIFLIIFTSEIATATTMSIYISDQTDPQENGSIDHPYDSFSDINWNQGGSNSIPDWVASGYDVVINLARGDKWRETLRIWTSGTPQHPITVTSYDSGDGSTAKPIISGAKIPNQWVYEGSNFTYSWPTNVGTMQVWEDDQRLTWAGASKTSGTLTSPGQWYYDPQQNKVVVRCTDNADLSLNPFAHTIEVGQRSGGIWLSNADNTEAKNNNHHIIIDGIQVEKVAGCGLTDNNGANLAYSIIVGNGYSCKIQNCTIRQMGGGQKYVWTSNGNWAPAIEFYRSYDCHAINNTIYDGHCVGISAENLMPGTSLGYTCINNTIYDIKGIGLNIDNSGGDFYNNTVNNCGQIDGWNQNAVFIGGGGSSALPIKFYHNRIYNSVIAIRVYHNNSFNLSIFYNIVSGFSQNGLFLSDDSDDVDIYNNVIYDNNAASYGGVVIDRGIGQCNDIQFKNNIVFVRNTYCLQLLNSNEVTSDYNCFYRVQQGFGFNFNKEQINYNDFSKFQSFSNQDKNSIIADPLFVNPNSNTFTLNTNSPCIDAGINVGLTSDLDGLEVPQGKAVDIGAFEFKSILSPPKNLRLVIQ